MMSPDQLDLEQTTSRLLAQRDTVLADIRARLHASGDQGRMALLNHLETGGDWVEADLLADTDIALLSHELVRLREIDAALARIKVGSYGTCKECGEAIAPGRLNAQPTAECCLQCQERFEKEHGIGHRASL
jgi:DnaK suppressor protein